ncbi:MAG: DUF2207 domain-containing protein [Spirochaetaceae bacterium]|nr:DUF2207 domain-containing protein [Spirochaetaceae bacterium]
MKSQKEKIFKFGILFTLILFNSLALFAYDNTMYIQALNINVEVSEDNQYKVNEQYDFNYLSQHHGFYREIPTNYQKSGYYTILKNISSDNPYSIDSTNNSTIIKVGDANQYVTGVKNYNVNFTLDVGKNYKEEQDGKTYFYYNLVGQYWDFPINNVAFHINFPKAIEADKISFTSGRYGATETSATYTLSSDKKSISGTLNKVMPGEALTLYVDLPKGYFSGERDYLANVNKNFIFAILISALIILLGIITFIKYGRDEDIIEVQSFNAPKGFNPMKLGYFLNKTVAIKDTTAMLFYWADQGFITIKEDVEAKEDFYIVKVKELPSSCDLAERKLFQAYFNDKKIGDKVNISDFGKTFVEMRQKSIDRISESFNIQDSTELVDKDARKAKNAMGIMAAIAFLILGYYTPVNMVSDIIASTLIPFGLNTFFLVFLTVILSKLINNSVTSKKTTKLTLIILSIIITLACALFNLAFIALASFENIGYKFAILNIISVVAVSFLISISEKKSVYATKNYGTILGYKSFIEFVEIDKLKMMIDEDPNLFYHSLSYAIVLGLEKKWYKKFETLNIPKNNNFIFFGYTGMYYASVFNNMSNGINHSITQSISSVQSSGSSGGTSSGGFSGGGFGGGGGGGW